MKGEATKNPVDRLAQSSNIHSAHFLDQPTQTNAKPMMRPYGPKSARVYFCLVGLFPYAPRIEYLSYIWAIFGVNVGNYSIHGASGVWNMTGIFSR